MKKLQNDLTIIEQSKRLLELGVPKNSANYYYGKDGKLHYFDGTIPYSLLWATGCTPCWSVGRLIEIYNICADYMPGMQLELDKEPEDCTYIELIIASFELAADDGLLDFSKLEE